MEKPYGVREITPRIIPDLIDFEKELFELPVKVCARLRVLCAPFVDMWRS